MQPIIVTGIGTSVGKTLISAILVEALQADYWKPVQAGFESGTDSDWIKSMICNKATKFYPEVYTLKLAASPHISAREEGIKIDLQTIENRFNQIIHSDTENDSDRTDQHSNVTGRGHLDNNRRKSILDFLVIEGAGGLMVPLNENEFVVDFIQKLKAKVIIVSRNYLGSINHSLLTGRMCNMYDLDVIGWIFNDQYLNYEDEIVRWSRIPKIGSVPFSEAVNKEFILQQAEKIRPALLETIENHERL